MFARCVVLFPSSILGLGRRDNDTMNGSLNRHSKESILGPWNNQTTHILENLLCGESTAVPRVYKNWKFQSSRSWVYNSLYPWVIVAAIRLKASKSSHCEERWLADNNKLILRCGVICHPQTPILPHATPKPRLFYTWKNSSVLHVRYQRW